MGFKKSILAICVSMIAVNSISASGSPSPFDRFSFDYAVQGDARAKPLQVFDDGQKTYLQYRSTDDIPAFISANGGQLLMPRQEGPYTVLYGTPRDFIAQMGSARVRITHSSSLSTAPQYQQPGSVGTVPMERVAAPALYGSGNASVRAPLVARNEWTDNSYATPVRGDQVNWSSADVENSKEFLFERGSGTLDKQAEKRLKQLASSITNASRVEILAADDTNPADVGGSERVRVVRNILIAAGIKQSVIQVKVGFLFDDQLLHSGKKLYNPTTIKWSVAHTGQQPVRKKVLEEDGSMAVIEAMRRGQISPSQAVARLQETQSLSAPLPVKASWSIRKSDLDIEHLLQRWANDAGWKVIWKGAPTVQITADTERPLTHPDFIQAADYVVTQAKNTGYQIKATAYSNHVLVITGE